MKWNIYKKSTQKYLGTAHGATEEEAIEMFIAIEGGRSSDNDLEARVRDE